MQTDTDEIAALLGAPVETLRELQGGDISQVRLVTLTNGCRAVLKEGPRAETEARMLKAMAAAGAPVPKVYAAAPGVLAMEFLPSGAASSTSWATLGQALSQMHAVSGPGYGWTEDYAFGKVEIPGKAPSGRAAGFWPDFWAGARLAPSIPHVPAGIARRLERLLPRLSDILPARPVAGLLHGDLWQGNLHFGPEGRVHLIDPACCYGHGEVDLAMLHLFGQPDPAFASAYGPLPAGWQERRAAYQLWPALVHLRLFGGGYAGLVDGLLTRLGV